MRLPIRPRMVAVVTALGVLTWFISASVAGVDRVRLNGTGATFPSPLYVKWFKDYNRLHPRIQVNYQAKGSGAGVRDFVTGLVDFGASDAAMKPEEIAQVERGVVLLPVTAGSIVLAYRLDGLDAPLRLSRDAYVSLFLGEIETWDDPRIQACNPGVVLPHTTVTVVRRAEGSGTTFVFTKHLGAISEAWRHGPGVGKNIAWHDKAIGARGNAGVTLQIESTDGAIGYVEFGFAEENNLDTAWLENRSGNYVEPSLASARLSLARLEMPEDRIAWIADPTEPRGYPIVSFSWLLLYRRYDDAEAFHTLADVIRYCVSDGQSASEDLGYVPLPESIRQCVLAGLAEIDAPPRPESLSRAQTGDRP